MARLASLHAYLHADEAEPPKPALASVKQEAVQPEHAQVSLVCSTLFFSSARSLWVRFALFEGRRRKHRAPEGATLLHNSKLGSKSDRPGVWAIGGACMQADRVQGLGQ